MLFLAVLLCSECFPPRCSCKCGPSCNDAAHRKTPFSCDLRQPLELIPGKPFLAFLSYAFLRTRGQSDDWSGEERSDDWGRVVQQLGGHLKFRKIVDPVLFLCAVLLFALQFARQGRHVRFSVAPLPNSKTAALLCSWQLFPSRLLSTAAVEGSQLEDTVQCSAPINLQHQACSQLLCYPKPLHFMIDPLILAVFLPNLLLNFSMNFLFLERHTRLLLLETQRKQERFKKLHDRKT